MQAPTDPSAGNGQAGDAQQQSIYAQNRAVYEASLNAAQQSGDNPTTANGGGGNASQMPGFSFNATAKQSRPRSNSPERPPSATANGNTSPQQPARKKLLRAGDLEARNGPQEPSGTENSPATPASAGAGVGAGGMSMREQIARARLPGTMAAPSPTGGAYPQNGQANPYGATGQPSYSPPPQANVGVQPGQPTSIDQVIEQNAQAFVAKNPSVHIEIVRGALKHSRGLFDSNFHQAMQLLLQQQKTNLSNSQGPGTPVGSQPAMPRYPGQQTNPNPVPQGNYPGFNPYQGAPQQQQQQQQQQARPQQIHPHQMQPGSSAQNINGHSAAALGGQRFYPGQSQSPAGATQQLPQQVLQPPPPILVGTHMEIGFSALQVLPKEQHNQFLQLAPSQQTNYSLQVYQSLSPVQQADFTQRFRQAEEMRRQYYAQQNAQLTGGPGGRQGNAQNPYIGYASQMPTAQQQQQQQRFPGQNPVFRVGAPSAGGQQVQYHQQQPPHQQQQQQPAVPMHVSHPEFMANQQRILLEQMTPAQREQFYGLTQQAQQQWVWSQVQAKQEHARRQAAQHQRNKQQAMMSKTVQAAKDAKAVAGTQPGGKKRRRKAGSDDDDSGDLGLHDEDSDEDRDDDNVDGPDGSEAEEEREAKAIVWFNECKKEELTEMTACSETVAEAVVEMRPYLNPSDIRGKLRKRKGVSGNLFDNYVDLMYSYAQTDECLAKCVDIGKELLDVMTIWTGGKKFDPTPSMRPSAEPEDGKKPDIAVNADAKDEDIKVEIKGESQSQPAPDIQVDQAEDIKVKPDEVDMKPVADPSGDLLAVPADEKVPAPAVSAESTLNMGTELVTVSEDVLNQSTKEDASEEVKKAFEDYLYSQPKLLKEGIKLKNYQMLGVNWLNMLYRKNISCILADEMGLGKTAQVIALIAHLKEKGKPGPHLVIVPSSTLDNWMREFEVFAPALKVFAYYGNQTERADARYFFKQEPDLDVIVTTYNMATGAPDDRKFLKKMEFKACVFDEGHQLKNAESKKYKDLMDIKVRWRLLLTGTPLQNNLQELVSLLSFILPKIFLEAQESLRAIFKVPPEAQKNLLTRQRVRAAKSVMTPFVLRRKKAQVLQDLPAKIEKVEYCEMTPLQRDIYRETLAKHKKTVIEFQASGTATPAEGQPPPKKKGRAAPKSGKIVQENTTSNVLMSLRKAANHPMLFRRLYDDKKIKQMAKDCLKEEEFADRNVDYIYEDMDLMTDFELHRFVLPYKHLQKHALKKDEWMEAGKVQKLAQMLPEMKARGDRVLIFSQFVQVLDILAYVLKTMDMKYLTLTGQTNVNDRQGLVDEFTNDDSITCFLLSTRAGGLGLNLMAANVVIIMDMDFNPHNDKQAQDRAYRLGQKREVTIYKFVTKGTIEEDMLALADTKLALDQQVSAESAVSGDLAASIELAEEEGVVEKKVKASLMTTLQSRFETDAGEQEYQATQAAGGPGTEAEAKAENGESAAIASPATPAAEVIPARKRAAAAGKARRQPSTLKAASPAPAAEAAAEDESMNPEAKEEDGEGEKAEGEQEEGANEDDDDALSSIASSGGSEFQDDGE